MESVNKRIIFISVILAVFTSLLVFVYIRNVTAPTPEAIEYINVYVAAKTMPAKYLVTNEDLKQIKVTKEFINPQAVLNKADIVGKRLKDRIIEGEQILKDRLVGENNLSLAFNIPEGKRAVSINVNEQSAVGNMVRPGDFVDVIVTFQKDEIDDKTNKYIQPSISVINIQNIQVLAIGQRQSVEEENIGDPPKTLTLAVTPQEAEKLVFSSDFGTIRLALRPVGDDKIQKTEGIIRNDAAPMKGYNTLTK